MASGTTYLSYTDRMSRYDGWMLSQKEGLRSLVLNYRRLALHEALLSWPLLMSTLTCYNPGGDRAIQTATFLPTVHLKRFKQIVLIIKGHKWLYQKKTKHINPDPCIHFAEFHFVVWYWSCPLLCLTMLILFSRRNDVENIAGVSGNGMEIQSSIKTWQDEYDLS